MSSSFSNEVKTKMVDPNSYLAKSPETKSIYGGPYDDQNIMSLGQSGMAPLSDFSAGKGYIEFSTYGKGINILNFPTDTYFSFTLPGCNFDKSTDFFECNATFYTPRTTYVMTYSEYITPENMDHIYQPTCNFYLTRNGDVFSFWMHLKESLLDLPSGYPDKDVLFGREVRINFPEEYTPTFASFGNDPELSFSENTYKAPIKGMKWEENIFDVVFDKTDIFKDSGNYIHPLELIKCFVTSKASNGSNKTYALTGFNKEFGDYFWNKELVANGRVRDYKFYMAEAREDGTSYYPEKEYWLRVRTTDDVPPRILIDGVDADSINLPIKISYTALKRNRLITAIDILKERTTVIDNSGLPVNPTLTLEGYEGGMKIEDFFVIINAKDHFGNSTTVKKDVQIIDDVPPVITIPAKEIKVSSEIRLTEEQILEYVLAEDEIDKEGVTLKLGKNPYHENGNHAKPGIYWVEVIASDIYGNVSRKDIAIVVEAPDNNSWVLSKGVVIITPDTVLKPMDIVERLVADKQLENLAYEEALIIEGSPIEGNNIPGEYKMTIEAKTENQGSKFITLTVRVLDNKGVQEKEDLEKTSFSFWENIVNFFKSIIDFFKALFGIA